MAEKVKFANTAKTDFFNTVRRRVDAYFEEKGISKHGNAKMVLKTISMFALFYGPYLLIISGAFDPWAMFAFACFMGIGNAGIGMSVMHDANHGGYSASSTVNRWIGYSINLIGGNAFTWKIQHNVLHHTFTNIYHHDEDLDPSGSMRFTPDAEIKPLHRFQHFYATFLYGVMTLVWVLHKDFLQLARYNEKGLIKGTRGTYRRELLVMIGSKVIYYIILLVIPMMLLDITFWQWLIAFLAHHFIAGVILGYVFQMAHVVESVSFPKPNTQNTIENEWAIHQMYTTANFARFNKLVSWYVGGLNYQVEHHLFPKICHVHYPSISEIVKKTAAEFNLPYNDTPTFWGALVSHFRLMRDLGTGKIPVPAA